MKLSKNCVICGKLFSCYSGERPNAKFCSKLCSSKGWTFWSAATADQKKERIKQLFNKRVIRKEGCWDWIGSTNSQGYANFKADNKMILAHRVSWELHNGQIPAGMYVLHKCDNRKCQNPSDLFIGTPLDNMHDMIKKGRGRYLFGEKNPMAKFTNNEIEEIRYLIKTGQSLVSIARKYNVNDTTIGRIKHGRTYRY